MRTRLPVVAATAGLALALTACSGEGAGPGPTAPESAASTAGGEGGGPPPSSEETTSTSSSSSEGDETTSDSADSEEPKDSSESSSNSSSTPTDTGKPFDPEEFTDRLQSAIAESPTAHISLEIEVDGNVAMSAEGDQDLVEGALDMDVEMADQKLGYRLVDGDYYFEQPPKWVPVTRDSDNAAVRQALDQIQVLSMRNQFDAFVAGVEDAGVKGHEEVGGVRTRHYTATVDTTRSMAELEVEKEEGMPDEVVYDVWLDSEDRIRRISFELNGATTTVNATHWGEPLDIEAPTGSELAESP